jgi:hypothetical protein
MLKGVSELSCEKIAGANSRFELGFQPVGDKHL